MVCRLTDMLLTCYLQLTVIAQTCYGHATEFSLTCYRHVADILLAFVINTLLTADSCLMSIVLIIFNMPLTCDRLLSGRLLTCY